MDWYRKSCKRLLMGIQKPNRTGTDTVGFHGITVQHHMRDGFPILTTKKVNFKAIVAELLGFIRGYSNAKDFREAGTKIWDANANQTEPWLSSPFRKGEDDLGRIYGVQWRNHRSYKVVYNLEQQQALVDLGYSTVTAFDKLEGTSFRRKYLMVKHVDQLKNVIDKITDGIDDRRLIVNSWSPGELDEMALPPCHYSFQFGLDGDVLSLEMNQRSCDFPLGIPFNVTSYSLLLCIIAQITGKTAGMFKHNMWDCHIYVNQIEALKKQLGREPYPLPSIIINPAIKSLKDLETWVTTNDFELVRYRHHPAISFPFSN